MLDTTSLQDQITPPTQTLRKPPIDREKIFTVRVHIYFHSPNGKLHNYHCFPVPILLDNTPEYGLQLTADLLSYALEQIADDPHMKAMEEKKLIPNIHDIEIASPLTKRKAPFKTRPIRIPTI